MEKIKYEEVKHNGWTLLGWENQDIICCSCNLVHEIDFKVKNGKLYARFRRNEEATKELRKRKNK